MANTRITLALAAEIGAAIAELLATPVRFLEPPAPLATLNDRVRLWNSLLPEDLQSMLNVGNKWGFGFATMTTAAFTVAIDGAEYGFSLGVEVDPNDPTVPGGYFAPAGYCAPSVAIKKQHWKREQPHIQDPRAFFGANCDAVLDWMRTVISDEADARFANAVLVNDLLPMCKSVGQLKRMVPDLLKYLPADKAAALHNQVRASTMPFEWASYDRMAVDRAITYIAKCHMLTGLGKPFRQGLMRDFRSTWVTKIPFPAPRI